LKQYIFIKIKSVVTSEQVEDLLPECMRNVCFIEKNNKSCDISILFHSTDHVCLQEILKIASG